MSSSESSDSEPESDPEAFEREYNIAQGSLVQVDDKQQGSRELQDEETAVSNSPEDEIKKLQKVIADTNAGPTEVKVSGSGNTINTGTTIIIKSQNYLEKIKEDRKAKRLEKIVGGIRDYYHIHLMGSPLPWIHLRSSIDEDFCVDLVIKQISDGGRDVR